MTTTPPPPAAKTRFAKKTPVADAGSAPATLIDARIAALPDWRGAVLAHVRQVILSVDPAITEEWKWNVPVWSCHGIVCTGETYQRAVKLTFPKGASLDDPSGLFNASLAGNARRAIDIAEGDDIDAAALRGLVQSAIALNRATAKTGGKTGR